MTPLTGPRWWWACAGVFLMALAALVPTAGDIGLTWDEPAYRYSQVMSAQWWRNWQKVHSWADVDEQLDPDVLLYYWPYARFGINFHPPLAGQLCLLTHTLFGSWMKDIPARRMASALEFAATLTILFGFLARRYGAWTGGVAAGSLLLMPRLYGDAHVAGTDTPGLLLWALATVAFWKGLREEGARGWRVAVGVLLGLAFVEKMGAVMVLLPLLVWLFTGHLLPALRRPERAAWADGLLTTTAMLVPLGLAFLEVRRLARALLQLKGAGLSPAYWTPAATNLFTDRPEPHLPGIVLIVPLAIWLMRRLAGKLFRSSPIWGGERPALEILTSILAFAPAIGWLGNPAWWRVTLPRLAHYYAISTTRRGVLPDIQILYFGQIYEYSLPWHNAWTLIAITVPASILVASVLGLLWSLAAIPRDRVPLYFLVHLVALPFVRMLPTPAHDGVRLFLPTFFFLAALAGWGTVAAADAVARLLRARALYVRTVFAALVLGPAVWQLARIHPFELSYYNELVGGPRGARKAGFEMAYWYDALNDQTLAEINARLPRHAGITFSNELSKPIMVVSDLQSLGKLRGDIDLDPATNDFPYMWLLTHDSKTSAFSRLLFGMTPFYARKPGQLDGLRVFTIGDPVAVSRAWAIQLLLDARDDLPPDPPAAPDWVRAHLPWLARLWGDGVTKARRLAINEPLLLWARNDPQGLRAAAAKVAAGSTSQGDDDSFQLMSTLSRYDGKTPGRRFSQRLLRGRPEAVREAVEIIIKRPDDLRTLMRRYPYTDPELIGGYLDRDLVKSAP
jgi:hypothetical protein